MTHLPGLPRLAWVVGPATQASQKRRWRRWTYEWTQHLGEGFFLLQIRPDERTDP